MHPELVQQLYQRYQRELYLYLYGLCRNQAQAEDLVQETFLKALLSLPDGHPNFRAWLYLVGRNLFLDQQRKNRRLTDLPEDHPDQAADLCDRLIADETRAALYGLLGQLEPKKREVLLLRYFANLSLKEIAAVLRLTPEHVRMLASRGQRELRRRMEELDHDL